MVSTPPLMHRYKMWEAHLRRDGLRVWSCANIEMPQWRLRAWNLLKTQIKRVNLPTIIARLEPFSSKVNRLVLAQIDRPFPEQRTAGIEYANEISLTRAAPPIEGHLSIFSDVKRMIDRRQHFPRQACPFRRNWM